MDARGMTLPYRILFLAITCAAIFAGGFGWAWAIQGDRAEDARIRAALDASTKIIVRQQIVNTVTTKTIEKIKVVKEQSDDVRNQIDEAAKRGDLDGELTAAFRLLYNAAATGAGLGGSAPADATPVAVETVARVTQENFATCRANAVWANGLIDGIEKLIEQSRKEK